MSDIAEHEYITREQSDAIRTTLKDQKAAIDRGDDPTVGDEFYTQFEVDGASIEVTCMKSKSLVHIATGGFNGDTGKLTEEVRRQVLNADVGKISTRTKHNDLVSFEVHHG